MSWVCWGLLLLMPPFDLPSEQWHHRVLLVFAPSLQAEQLIRQRELTRVADSGMRERDLVVAEIVSGEETEQMPRRTAEALRRQFHVKPAEFTVILVGKDGTEKRRTHEPLRSAALFKAIDRMPMRRQEMQR